MQDPASPLLAEVIRRAIEANRDSFWVSIPGRISRYDATKRVADVQPLAKGRRRLEDGSEIYEPLPVIPLVPVLFMGGGGYSATFPVRVGDHALLQFMTCSLDAWLETGGPALDERRGHLTDAVAIVGLHRPKAAPAASSSEAVFGKDGGPRVRVSAAGVSVDDGSGAVPLATLADLMALRNHVAALLVGGTGSALLPTTPTPTGTTILKGK